MLRCRRGAFRPSVSFPRPDFLGLALAEGVMTFFLEVDGDF